MTQREYFQQTEMIRRMGCFNKQKRFDTLVEAMGQALGHELNLKRGPNDNAWGRNMVAYQLAIEGWSENEIGQMMGKQHSSVHYMKERVNEMLSMPRVFWEEMMVWDKFKSLIK